MGRSARHIKISENTYKDNVCKDLTLPNQTQLSIDTDNKRWRRILRDATILSCDEFWFEKPKNITVPDNLFMIKKHFDGELRLQDYFEEQLSILNPQMKFVKFERTKNNHYLRGYAPDISFARKGLKVNSNNVLFIIELKKTGGNLLSGDLLQVYNYGCCILDEQKSRDHATFAISNGLYINFFRIYRDKKLDAIENLILHDDYGAHPGLELLISVISSPLKAFKIFLYVGLYVVINHSLK
ncbi:6136_t:CDS:2 [Entrophospora sp. SA101]|nr:6136_t:CDS:2 [Entrophospora sp. SA101]